MTYQIKKQEILNTLYSEGAVFITGGAGSGKSHMLRDITSMFRETVLLGPTGISASNIGGQTIHKFLGLSRSLFRPSDIVSDKKNDNKFVNLIKATDLIIVDEVSMCSPLILDTFDEVLRATTMNRNHLFGGKRVILCGDIAQLPPVVREEEAKFLSEEFGYKDMSPMSSRVFKEITVVELKGSYRQRDDQYFADTLNFIRRARMGSLEPGSIPEFNQKLFGRHPLSMKKK